MARDRMGWARARAPVSGPVRDEEILEYSMGAVLFNLILCVLGFFIMIFS